jgi:hypothetical protein
MQPAHEVVARGAPPLRHEMLEVAGHRQQAGACAPGLLERRQRCTDEGRQIVGPGDEVAAIGRGDVHQHRHHLGRQRPRQCLHEVEAGVGIHRVEQGVDAPLDGRRELLQDVAAKASVEHAADARVVRRVDEQHRPREELLEILQFAARRRALHHPAAGALRREPHGIAKHRLDIGMAGQQPCSAEELVAPMDRPSLAQRGVGRIGIRAERCIDDRTAERARRRRQHRAHR